MARVPIRMPKMSMTMTEGELSSWAIKVGDTVANGDVVCEVLTDKVDMEVESPAAGTLVEIVVESGMVPVGEPIGWIEAEGGDFTDLLDFGDPDAPAEPAADGDELGDEAPAPGSSPGAAGAATPVTPDQPGPLPGTASAEPESVGPVAAVPKARALARENGLDLRSVPATGPGGVVSVQDVRTALEQAEAPAAEVPAAEVPQPRPVLTPPQRKRAANAHSQPAPVVVASVPPQAAESRPASDKVSDKAASIRRAVARKMTESAAVPQFTVWRDLHLDAADSHRDGVSWTTVLLQSYARALRQVPRLLTRWDGEQAVDAGAPAVAMAVDTEHGLLVPVFSEPDIANPRKLNEEVKAVVGAARGGKVDGAHQVTANASISNLGGLGVDRFQALITPPQGSVLALGSISRRPVAVPGGIGTALVVTAGLTVDHRVADGADGARLLEFLADDLA